MVTIDWCEVVSLGKNGWVRTYPAMPDPVIVAASNCEQLYAYTRPSQTQIEPDSLSLESQSGRDGMCASIEQARVGVSCCRGIVGGIPRKRGSG